MEAETKKLLDIVAKSLYTDKEAGFVYHFEVKGSDSQKSMVLQPAKPFGRSLWPQPDASEPRFLFESSSRMPPMLARSSAS